MKILKIILVIFGLLAITIIAVYGFYSGFDTTKVRTEIKNEEIFIYEEISGNYSQTEAITNKIYNDLLVTNKIETSRGCGIFYDNPKEVEESQLRSEAGCLLDTPLDSLKMAELSQQYKIKKLEKADYITAEIPLKGPLSVVIGIYKVYPAMDKYKKENNLKEQGV